MKCPNPALSVGRAGLNCRGVLRSLTRTTRRVAAGGSRCCRARNGRSRRRPPAPGLHRVGVAVPLRSALWRAAPDSGHFLPYSPGSVWRC